MDSLPFFLVPFSPVHSAEVVAVLGTISAQAHCDATEDLSSIMGGVHFDIKEHLRRAFGCLPSSSSSSFFLERVQGKGEEEHKAEQPKQADALRYTRLPRVLRESVFLSYYFYMSPDSPKGQSINTKIGVLVCVVRLREMQQSLLLAAATAVVASASSVYDLSAVDIDGANVSFAPYAGNVSLFVNVATF